LKIVGLLEPD